MDPIVVLGVADQVLRALERGFPPARCLVTWDFLSSGPALYYLQACLPRR